MTDLGSEASDVNAKKLWTGGVALACVAALIAIVGIVITQGLLHTSILVPHSGGDWGGVNILTYGAGSATAALGATALLHQLRASATPRARSFFVSIVLLLTIISVIMPLTIDAEIGSRLATAAINLVIGLTITVTLSRLAGDMPQEPERPSDETWHDFQSH